MVPMDIASSSIRVKFAQRSGDTCKANQISYKNTQIFHMHLQEANIINFVRMKEPYSVLVVSFIQFSLPRLCSLGMITSMNLTVQVRTKKRRMNTKHHPRQCRHHLLEISPVLAPKPPKVLFSALVQAAQVLPPCLRRFPTPLLQSTPRHPALHAHIGPRIRCFFRPITLPHPRNATDSVTEILSGGIISNTLGTFLA